MEITAEGFMQVLMDSGINCTERQGRIHLQGEDGTLIDRLNTILENSPAFELSLLEYMRGQERMTPKDYVLELGRYGITCTLNDGRICLNGGTEKLRERCLKILEENTGLEVRLILHEAAHNADLLDEITERACIRWADGYSDSLYDAVLCNIHRLEETRDMRELSEREKTDWKKEIERYVKI